MLIRDGLEKNKDYIIKEIKNGKSCKSLAKEFNCNFWYFLKDYNIKSQYSRSKN